MAAHTSVTSQLVRTVIAGSLALASSLLLAALVYQVSFSSSSGPWAGFGARIIGLFVALVSYPRALLLWLYKFRVKNWLPIGIASAATLIVLFWGLANTQSNVTFSQSLFILGPFYLVILVLFWGIFTLVRAKIAIRVVLATGLGVLLYGGSILYVHYQGAAYALQQQKLTQRIIEHFNFRVFVPSYVPLGYHLYRAGYETSSVSGGPSFYSIQYLAGANDTSDPPPITINSFREPNTFNPPSKCGYDMPPDSSIKLSYTCQLIGTSASGQPIYFSSNDLTSSNYIYYFTTINNTEVVLASTGKNIGNDLTNAQAIAIINSLQPKTYDELQRIQPH